jgi:hypothetical protein
VLFRSLVALFVCISTQKTSRKIYFLSKWDWFFFLTFYFKSDKVFWHSYFRVFLRYAVAQPDFIGRGYVFATKYIETMKSKNAPFQIQLRKGCGCPILGSLCRLPAVGDNVARDFSRTKQKSCPTSSGNSPDWGAWPASRPRLNN